MIERLKLKLLAIAIFALIVWAICLLKKQTAHSNEMQLTGYRDGTAITYDQGEEIIRLLRKIEQHTRR